MTSDLYRVNLLVNFLFCFAGVKVDGGLFTLCYMPVRVRVRVRVRGRVRVTGTVKFLVNKLAGASQHTITSYECHQSKFHSNNEKQVSVISLKFIKTIFSKQIKYYVSGRAGYVVLPMVLPIWHPNGPFYLLPVFIQNLCILH